MNIAKFLRTVFFIEQLQQLDIYIIFQYYYLNYTEFQETLLYKEVSAFFFIFLFFFFVIVYSSLILKE